MTKSNSAKLPLTETLQSVFDSGCEQYKGNSAFKCGADSLTYGELQQSSRDFAAYLQTQTNLKPGDRIALQLPNCLAYPVLAWGAIRAGLVVVNVNPLYTKNELAHIYKDSGAKALVLLSSSIDLVTSLVDETDISLMVYLKNTPAKDPKLTVETFNYHEVLEKGSQCEYIPFVVHPSDIALLQYTGGTTGLSKGAVLTHANLISAARSFWNTTSVFESGNETFVAPLPLYHVYAFVAHLVVGVTYGVTSILISNPSDLNSFYTALQKQPFSLFVGINTLFNALCHDEDFKTLDFSGLKFTLSGGMALNRSVADKWQALTHCVINEGYGLTESSAGVIINTDTQRRLGSVGKPMHGVEIKVVADEGYLAKDGEKGELHIKGPQIMQQYWQKPEATKAVLNDGWLATGDVATIDEDGFVYIVDRIKDMIIVSGFNVYPAEIEQVVNRLEVIQECAVVGVESSDTGEAIELYVVLKQNGLTENAIIAHCRENLAAYKIPKNVIFIKELPKSPVGKILKRNLKAS
ncbi:AMP-binding protein [Paraglaciecola arctica]|uniref:AMP-binding protein n=1 Tax=Paraglaciecola arctica TaxID=1128911 RepID=UPI001C0788F0|nr:AMP-binding protein [Paraglaciecola arctica]MBU3004961.1 AMP-binding protein [Paraglaciecola arctica]